MNDLGWAIAHLVGRRPDWLILGVLLAAGLLAAATLVDREHERGLLFPTMWGGGWLMAVLIFDRGGAYSWVAPLLWIGLLGTALYFHVREQRWPSRDVAFWGKVWLCLSGTLASLLGCASSDAGSASPMVVWFIQTFGLDPSGAENLTVVFRKVVHFTFYGCIAGLALAGAGRLLNGIGQAVLFALLWTASYAAFDELYQLQFASRTGSIGDFLLDMAGAGAFVAVAVWRRRRHAEVAD